MGPFPVGCKAAEGEKQASIVKQGHHISVPCPWNERQTRACSEIHGLCVERIRGKTGAKSARHYDRDLIEPYPKNLLGAIPDYVNIFITIISHTTETNRKKI